MARAALVVLALAALGLVGSGCGEEEGVEEGATVTAYVEAPLCEGATNQVTEVESMQGGSVKVRFICLADPRGDGRVELATVGANARRSTEDSTTIAYIGEPGTTAVFSRPILEAAGIAFVTSSSGDRAMQRVLDAVSNAGSGSLRDEVREALELPTLPR